MSQREDESQPFLGEQQTQINFPIAPPPPIDSEQQYDKMKLDKTFKESMGVIPINLIFAIAFLYFSNQAKDDACVNLKYVSYFMGVVFSLGVIIRLCLLAPLVCLLREKRAGLMNSVYSVLNTIELLIQFFLLIALIVVFFQAEPCGSLHVFVAVYLIVILIGVLLFCCCLVCCGSLLLASSAAQHQG